MLMKAGIYIEIPDESNRHIAFENYTFKANMTSPRENESKQTTKHQSQSSVVFSDSRITF